MNWYYKRYEDGRFFASNGQVEIWANNIDDRNKLIRKYRHFKGVVSQRKDGSISEIQL